MRALLALILSACLVGCAATTPESLKKVERHEQIHLTEPVIYHVTRFGTMELGAAPGMYVAQREDVTGVYYFAASDEPTIFQTSAKARPKATLYRGGIFVPHVKTVAPRFFFIMERVIRTTDNVDAIVQSRKIETAANVDALVQRRIIETAANPGLVSPGAGLGVNVVGNVLGGALVNAMIESGIGGIEWFVDADNDAQLQQAQQTIRGAIKQIDGAASEQRSGL